MQRIHGHELSPTRHFVQKHFYHSESSSEIDKINKGRDKLFTIRETVCEGNF